MSFNQNSKGVVYAPGYFLAHEECERKTKQFKQADATTAENGAKYIPMGSVYTENSEPIGFAYEDVDVSTGDMPGSVVTKGTVYENRLPATLDSKVKTALVGKGFKFITESNVTRPDWTNA